MVQKDEIFIEDRLPFRFDKCIVGIGLTPARTETVRNSFAASPYKFVDIESALLSISNSIADYAFPGSSLIAKPLDARSAISCFIKIPSESPCIIRQDYSSTYCLPVGDVTDEAFNKLIASYVHDLSLPEIRFSISSSEAPVLPQMTESPKRIREKKQSTYWKKISDKFGNKIEAAFDTTLGDIFDAEDMSEPEPEPELEPKATEIINAIDGILATYGITMDELDAILSYKVTLSHLHITHSGRIILTDFGGKEVRMDTLSKALFFLYLKHPEGIRFKDLIDHRDELKSIYMGITGRDNPEEIDKSIDDLVNPLSNAVNVKSSRIKAAFRNVVADRVARFYYIDGLGGSAKKIMLDRDFVIWE